MLKIKRAIKRIIMRKIWKGIVEAAKAALWISILIGLVCLVFFLHHARFN